MIKVSNEVQVYEVNGKETPAVDCPKISVHSHWNETAKVTLEIEGKKLTVLARDLGAAIANATNIARF